MATGWTRFLWVVAFVIGLAGCTSIHSDAVRKLIAMEGEKIEAATNAAKTFRTETDARIEALKKSLADLDKALKQEQASEHMHALIFSSNQNVTTKRGADAYAVAYLISQIYVADNVGLGKRPVDQFNQDFDALRDLASQIDASWESLKGLHAGVQNFAMKSPLTSVDPNLLAAVVGEVPGASEKVEAALKNAKKVNEALERGLSMPALRGPGLERGRSMMLDLIDLLERVKK